MAHHIEADLPASLACLKVRYRLRFWVKVNLVSMLLLATTLARCFVLPLEKVAYATNVFSVKCLP